MILNDRLVRPLLNKRIVHVKQRDSGVQKGRGAEGATAPGIHSKGASNQRVKLKLSFLKFKIIAVNFVVQAALQSHKLM